MSHACSEQLKEIDSFNTIYMLLYNDCLYKLTSLSDNASSSEASSSDETLSSMSAMMMESISLLRDDKSTPNFSSICVRTFLLESLSKFAPFKIAVKSRLN